MARTRAVTVAALRGGQRVGSAPPKRGVAAAAAPPRPPPRALSASRRAGTASWRSRTAPTAARVQASEVLPQGRPPSAPRDGAAEREAAAAAAAAAAGEDDNDWLPTAAEAASPFTDRASMWSPSRQQISEASETSPSPRSDSGPTAARRSRSAASRGSRNAASPGAKLRSLTPDGKERTTQRTVDRSIRREVFSARARQGPAPSADWDAHGRYIGQGAEAVGAPRQRSAPARRNTEPLAEESLRYWEAMLAVNDEEGGSSEALHIVHGQVVGHVERQRQREQAAEVEGGKADALSGAIAGQAAVLQRAKEGRWREVGGRAATRVQSIFRGFLVRRHACARELAGRRWAELEEHYARADADAAATYIQKRVRGMQGRRYVREWEQTREAAVIVLQWRWREHIIRRDQKEAALERTAAAAVIQEWWAGFGKIREARALRERKRALFLREELARAERERLRREHGASSVQGWWRACVRRRRLIENERFLLQLRRETRLGLFTFDESAAVRSARHAVTTADAAAAERCAHAPPKVLHNVSREVRRRRRGQAHAETRSAVARDRMAAARKALTRHTAALRLQTWYRATGQRCRFVADRAKMRAAAVNVQRCFRGYVSRNRTLKEKRRRRAAATRIQSWWRMLVLRTAHLKLCEATCVLQASWKGLRQRREWALLRTQRRLERDFRIRCAAATRIQSAERGRAARREVEGMRRVRAEAREARKRAAAVALLGRVLRGDVVRRRQRRRQAAALAIQVWLRFEFKHRLFHARWLVQVAAAETIQRCARCHLARAAARRAKTEFDARQLEEYLREEAKWAASMIQCCVRGAQAKVAARKRREHIEEIRRQEAAEREHRRRDRAALRIQTRWRGFAARLTFHPIMEDCRKAALTIQRRWRGYCTRVWFDMYRQACWHASHVLQRFGRHVTTRSRVRERRRVEAERREDARRRAAAVLLQALCRGMIARRRRRALLRRRFVAAVDIQRIWHGYRTRCVTRGTLWMRSAGARRVQRTWRGVRVRRRYRVLREQRAARWRQQRLWEKETFLALHQRLERVASVEGVQRPCLEEVEHSAFLDLMEAFHHDGRRVRRRQQQLWDRRRLRQRMEAAEQQCMSAIDEELLEQWRAAVAAWEAERAARRGSIEDGEGIARVARAGEEELSRGPMIRSCQQSLRQARVRESQRVWAEEREREEAEAERRRREEEAGLNPHERRMRGWKEARLGRRRDEDAQLRDERRRRKLLSAREKCSEFAHRYVARRIVEARTVAVAVEDDDEDTSPWGSPSKREQRMVQAYSPQRWTSPPRTVVRDAAGLGEDNARLNRLQHSYRPPSAGPQQETPSLSPLLLMQRPASAAAGKHGRQAAEWLKQRHSPAMLAGRPTSAGGGDRRQHAVPGASARGRVQHYLPLLAANDRGLVEVDLVGAGLSDVLVHSLAVALRTNHRCSALLLDGNGLRNGAATTLAAALQSHASVTSVSLRDNRLTDAGVQALAAAAQSNAKLRRVDVTGNSGVSSAALEELERALLTNAQKYTYKLTGGSPASEPTPVMLVEG
eukprot:TRINITY_DN1849_c0_g2_i1.p1 TRINITY_DN1849_c0_g2~~TRINITY_DN1849_c0_g2_i1.p1  ORF type:complete len:1542 (+),score=613.42 TRINITY_DN1849_c0_g2_i1:376-5001(+)